MKKEAELLKSTRNDIFGVDVRSIVIPDGFNKRLDYGDIESLMNSMLENGQRTPLRVQKVEGEEKFILIDGFRRMKAINMAIEAGHEFARVSVIKVPKGYTEEEKILDIILCNDGKPLSLLEFGLVSEKLLNMGWTADEVTIKTGKSTTLVSNALSLTKVSKKIKKQIIDGAISGDTVVKIIKTVKTTEEQEEMIEEAVKNAQERVDKKGGKGSKKATAKDVKVLKNISPLKKLETLRDELELNGVKNVKTELLEKLVSRLKAKVDIDELFELFK